ncbi:hypothetical protein [Aneurinibacillus terranovensis]|uniref:DUF4376 domain-containing protein n=1 Tax=Aneurinibacillus terranovensis TaxID=278991 RepID=UPI000404E9D5|nr:hypothetical protein [Aneurinibacillus terranovensis]
MNYWFLYTKSTGEIYGAPYLGSAEEWTNIPDGCAVLGPFSEDDADAAVKDAFANADLYVVSNGMLTRKPDADTVLLQREKDAKLTELTNAYYTALAMPFTSSASGTPILYSATQEAWAEMQKQLLMNANGIAKWPVPWRAADGSIVNLDEMQFKQLASDLRDMELAYLARFRSIEEQIKADTTDSPEKVESIAIDFSNLQTTAPTTP